MKETFQDRMFMGSEAIYARIEAGEEFDVTAALGDARLQASVTNDEQPHQ
ncbi:hypothetical protein [Streptomyces spongiicola]|nr:hypothetical protein [Streptomyces spongiicola]